MMILNFTTVVGETTFGESYEVLWLCIGKRKYVGFLKASVFASTVQGLLITWKSVLIFQGKCVL